MFANAMLDILLMTQYVMHVSANSWRNCGQIAGLFSLHKSGQSVSIHHGSVLSMTMFIVLNVNPVR